MADLSGQGVGRIYIKPQVMDYANTGTVAGTVTLSNESCYIDSIQITTPKASAKFILYDSAGTSTNVIGTLTSGTQTFDHPYSWKLGFRTFRGLTVANDADFGGIVIWGK